MSRKQDIIDAATELFSQKGYHATSTHQLAKLAEVSEGIIFYYFKTKEDILLEIFYDSFDTFLESLQRIMDEAPTGQDALRAWVGIHFEAIDSRAKNILLLVRDFPASLANEDSPHREKYFGPRGQIAPVSGQDDQNGTKGRIDRFLRSRTDRPGSAQPC